MIINCSVCGKQTRVNSNNKSLTCSSKCRARKRKMVMSEIEILKERINESGFDGLETSVIRDDYEPAGDMMIRGLTESGEYVTRKSPAHSFNAKWRIFKLGREPY